MFKKLFTVWFASGVLVLLLSQWSWTGYSFCFLGLLIVLPSLAFKLPTSLFCNLVTAWLLGSFIEEHFWLFPPLSLALTCLLYSLRRQVHRDHDRHLVLAAFFSNACVLVALYGLYYPCPEFMHYALCSQLFLFLCAKSFIRFQRWLLLRWLRLDLSCLPPL